MEAIYGVATPPQKGLTQQGISWQQVGQNFRTYQENPSVIVLGNNNQNLSYAFRYNYYSLLRSETVFLSSLE